jgi:hypothetical protein
MTSSDPAKVNRSSLGNIASIFSVEIICQTGNQNEGGSKQRYLARFSLGILFYPEDGSDMFSAAVYPLVRRFGLGGL